MRQRWISVRQWVLVEGIFGKDVDPALHFIQEDSPAEIGQAVAEFVQEIP